MSEELSDAEKMRLKRLAKLGGNSTPQAVERPETPKPAPAKPSPAPVAAPTKVALGKRPVSSTPPPIQAPPVARAPRPSVPYAQWEASKVAQIFGVTLDRGEAERSDWQLCWLKELSEELKEEGVTAISVDLADRLLIARLQIDRTKLDDPDMLAVVAGLPPSETTFEYLIGCWRRLYAANRELNRSGYDKATWTPAFEKIKGLLISYCGMSLEDPSMFPQPADKPLGPAEFLPILLSISPTTGDPLASSAPIQTDAILPADDLLPFLNDLANGVSTEQLADTIMPTLSLCFQEWFKLASPDLMGQEWQRYLGAVTTLTQVKPIAALLPTLGIWVAPGVTAPKLEWQSLLGPLSRLSVYPRDSASIWKTYFSNPTERKVADIDANKANLRHTLESLQSSLFAIYNNIVRASPASREGVLAFFELVVKLNEKRAGMRVDPRLVSSDGFMTNIHVVLLKLFEPVMDASFSKIDKVDPEYYRYSTRVNITDETKVRATKEEADEYFKAQPRPANFISDIFFLLNATQHLGLAKTIDNRMRAERNISDIEKELRHAEAVRGDWAGNPAMQTQGEAAIKKYKDDIAVLHASIHAWDTQLQSPTLVRSNVSYLGFLMTWLIRLVSPGYPQAPISFPLAPSSIDFRMLPEYLFENIANYFEFLSRYLPDALDDADKNTLIDFVIVFLQPDYVNNPFLRAKLVAIIANGLYPTGYWRKGTLFDRLSVQSLATDNLMPTLIRFWIDVEATGGHTQFWDKFNFRRDISRVFKSMWSNPLHREAFVKSRHTDFDQFIRFINMLMNDTTFHLDESLQGLAKINELQKQVAGEAFQHLPQNERDDANSQLRQAEGSAPFHTQMGLDHIELIRDLTATTKEPFVTAEIVDRLVASLDENLSTLVGPKMQELKLAEPEKYHFKPKRLLAAIAQVYLNLAGEGDFIRAVANDGRSYKRELFDRFARVLRNRAIMTEAEVAEVAAFTEKVEVMKATIAIEDEREIPDEFTDPLLGTLMKDPVILPMSGIRIDRATIRTSLLSKEVDPFNNQPLKIEQCLPDEELKARIDAWVAEGKSGMDIDV